MEQPLVYITGVRWILAATGNRRVNFKCSRNIGESIYMYNVSLQIVSVFQ